MKTNIKHIFRLIALALPLWGLGGSAFAQSDDFGMDFSLDVEKKIRPGMSFSVEGEARTQDNTRKIERWTVGGVFDMRLYQSPSKTINVKASLGWKYMWRYFLPEVNTKYSYSLDGDGNAVHVYDGYNDKEGYWRGSHRLSASLSASYKPSKRWEFSLKETFQYTYSRKANTMVAKYRLIDEDDPDGGTYLKGVDEKQYELWFENCRFHDLVRWAAQGKVDLNEVFNTRYGGIHEKIPTVYDEFFTKEGATEHKLYTTYSVAHYNKFKVGLNEYLPFPYDVKNGNPNLKDVLGWEYLNKPAEE